MSIEDAHQDNRVSTRTGDHDCRCVRPPQVAATSTHWSQSQISSKNPVDPKPLPPGEEAVEYSFNEIFGDDDSNMSSDVDPSELPEHPEPNDLTPAAAAVRQPDSRPWFASTVNSFSKRRVKS